MGKKSVGVITITIRGREGLSPDLVSKNRIVEVALCILSAPVTSAATERTFRAFSLIHSKKTNSLTSEGAAKVTYFSYNWKPLHVNEKIKRKKQKVNIIDQGNKEQEIVQSFMHEERKSLEKDNLSSSSDSSDSESDCEIS